MKAKLILLILLSSIMLQGYISSNAGGETMEEKNSLISTFSSVTIGMTYSEVIETIGEPTDSIGAGIVWQRYKLDDGWYMNLLFLGDDEKLFDIQIVDYTNNREFILKENS